MAGSSDEERFSIKLDSDWSEDAEEELRAIESAYAAAKRKISDFNLDELSSSQRRRLPGWANLASPSRSTTQGLYAGNGDRICKVDGSPSPCPSNGVCTFTPTPCQGLIKSSLVTTAIHGVAGNLKPRHPIFTFGGRTVYCRTFAEVVQATNEILDKIEQLKYNAEEISLGFDLEWKPIFTKGQASRKTAVLQICMDSSDCYVMHIIHSGIPPILKSVLEDPSLFKVGIGIANDAAKISREYNIRVETLVDLSRYANLKLGGAPRNWGLCSLTEMLTCKQLLKSNKIRMGNWEASELSKDQIHYAATDAFASWYLYQILKTFPDPKA